MSVELVRATAEHAHAIAENARQADIEEMWAAARSTPLDAMLLGIKLTKTATTALLDGKPVAMFGVTPYSILRGWGVPWFIGTESLDTMRARKELIRTARVVIADMRAGYSQLMNSVDERNTAAQQWLAMLGFTLLDPAPLGVGGELFRPFFWKE